MNIGIDFDGVLADVATPWLQAYNRESGDSMTLREWVVWDPRPILLAGWQYERFFDLRTPELYKQVSPIPGAREGVKALQEAGHQLVVVTADTLPFCQAKLQWLKTWMPSLTQMVAARDKNAVRFDVLIDDGPHNRPDVLFAQPWNRNQQGHEVQGWAPWQVASDWDDVVAWVRVFGILRSPR